MKITFLRPYKSIVSSFIIDLPNFVVLTGVNGSGKSHFLESIQDGGLRVDTLSNEQDRHLIKLFTSQTISPSENFPQEATTDTYNLKKCWEHFADSRDNFNFDISQLHMDTEPLKGLQFREILALSKEDLEKLGIDRSSTDHYISEIRRFYNERHSYLSSSFVGTPQQKQKILNSFESKRDFIFFDLTENEFFNCNIDKIITTSEIFKNSLSLTFKNYRDRYRQNAFYKWRSSTGENFDFLEDDAFFEKFGHPPWDLMNTILESANLDFEVTIPNMYEDRAYNLKLINKINKNKVNFHDLSSGEKILISFAILLHSSGSEGGIDKPHLLLLDEIDAHLHPSMTKNILKIIQNTIVNDMGIKVIMTTHSPSTVALVEDQFIYCMEKSGPNRVRKISKDAAIANLLSGVPSLSITYENRKQIFTESFNDANYHTWYYEALREQINPEISLTFIASGTETCGGCDRVKLLVKQLFENGNKNVFGLIDWDLKNQQSGNIKIVGPGSRYSIENYVLDPLLVAILLLHEQFITPELLGFTKFDSAAIFPSLTNEKLQFACNFVLERLQNNISQNLEDELFIPISNRNDFITCHYVGGAEIILPKWILQTNGHTLQNIYKKTFREFGKYSHDNKLLEMVFRKVINLLPGFISVDILNTYKKIEENK